MTLDYIKNIIDGYLYKLQSINSYDVDLYKKEYSIALKQFTDSFDALSQLHPELIQVNMPDIIGDEDAIRFKQVLEANASTRYSIDILPTGNYYHDKIMGEVSTQVAKECEKINRGDILDEIRKSATNKLVEKLDSNLDAVTDEYTKNLNNMGKIYEALATKLERKA